MSTPTQIVELVDSLDAIVFETDVATSRFTFVSQRAVQMLGYPTQMWLEDPDFWSSRVHSEDRDAVILFCGSAIRAREDHSFEYRFRTADDRYVWLRGISRVVVDDGGTPVRLRGILIDVTAQKLVAQAVEEVEAARQKSERHFRSLIENSSDLLSILDPDGTVRYASPSHERILGLKPSEIEGRNAFDLVHPDDREGLLRDFGNAVSASGYTDTREFRYATRDGNWRTLEARATSRFDDPAVRGMIINLRDVTDRKQADDELRRRLRRERLLADVSSAVAGASPSTLDDVVRHVLGLVGEETHAQRLIIGLFSHGHGTAYPRFEWKRQGLQDLGGDLTAAPAGMFPWMMARLENDGCADVPDVDAHPDGPERSTMERLGMEAARAVRMMTRGKIVGFVISSFDRGGLPPREDHLPLLRIAGEIIANALARQQEADALSALLSLSRQLSSTLDLEGIFAAALPAMTRLLAVDKVLIDLNEGEGTRFRLAAQHGVDLAQQGLVREPKVHPGHPLYEALRTGRSIVANDIFQQPWYPTEDLVALDVSCFIAAPLTVKGELRGIISCGRRRGGREFDTNEVELFEGIAHQVSLAVARAEIYREQEAQATVASALARVGREVVSSLDQPVLLDSLSRLTTELVGSEFTHTYLWSEEEESFVLVATDGESPEHAESLRVLRFPRALVAGLMTRLEAEEVVHLSTGGDRSPMPVAQRFGIESVAYVALRRGNEQVGAIATGWRTRCEPLTQEQVQILRGIGQLTSLALANANVVAELERLSRLKSDFVATMSHELRTPLNVIMGYNDLLLDQSFGPLPEEQAEVVSRMRRSAGELLELINATLDMSRLDTGRLPVERRTIDVEALLREIEAETAHLTGSPGVDVVWGELPPLPLLHTDPTKLKVVIKNLLGNARKFTDQGCIRITASTQDGGIEIAVADTGIGIGPEAQAIIFEAFRQGDSSSTRRHGGVGLGLYIVRRLLDLMGGRISLESAPGRGSTFRVWLPLESVHCINPAVASGERA